MAKLTSDRVNIEGIHNIGELELHGGSITYDGPKKVEWTIPLEKLSVEWIKKLGCTMEDMERSIDQYHKVLAGIIFDPKPKTKDIMQAYWESLQDG